MEDEISDSKLLAARESNLVFARAIPIARHFFIGEAPGGRRRQNKNGHSSVVVPGYYFAHQFANSAGKKGAMETHTMALASRPVECDETTYDIPGSVFESA